MKESFYRGLFLIGALYDAVLGLLFLLFPVSIYTLLNMTLPSNLAYLSMSATLFTLYGLLLFMISRNPKENRTSIIYASLVKFGFVVVILYYLLASPELVEFPFIVLAAIDLMFGILFLQSLKIAKK